VNIARSEVEEAARAGGAALVGVADVPEAVPPPYRAYPRAIVAAVPLSRGVMDTCRREPSRAYAYHYRVINAVLDNVAGRLVSMLESRGCETMAVPASQIVDWEELRGDVSHSRLAQLAGLGFIGRNNLLVTPQFGAAVRLVTVFADAALEPDEPAAGDCGACDACRGACPVGAIGEDAEGWDRNRCVEALRDFKKRLTNQHICGVCVRACAGARARP
jgi:epoxyqueuosine reductase